jgi:RNA polymerase sigma-70 factor (ECF subfamily)
MRFFQRRLKNPADAEDLTQEVFLHLVRSSPDSLQEPQRYIFRVATNVLRDRLRRGTVRRAGDHIPIENPDLAGELSSAERVYQRHQVLERVLEVLSELTQKCRTVFVLKRFQGLSYTEIARRLGVSRSAIEKHMHAIEVLAERFPE